MRALALGLALVALPALAQPSDAPVRQIIKAGQPAPQDGCFLNNPACTNVGKELSALRAENKSLKEQLDAGVPMPLVVAALVLGFVGGAAAAFVATR